VSEDAEFEAFYTAVFGRLVGQVYLITGDLHEAEDAVQEALTRAATRWPQLRTYTTPETWVRRVAINLARDGLRRARRRLVLAARLRGRAEAPAASEEELAVTQALAALPPAQRAVIVAHHVFGLPVEEIAAQLGMPVGTVKSRLARGRQTLAARLTATTEEDQQQEVEVRRE
jgi:RNA polymerase sigma-70 factor, ECF subfamily